MERNMKPMLLPRELPDLDNLKYPVIVSPKLDGIRCLMQGGVALSRTLKPIPNKHIQEWANTHCFALQGFDGELIVGNATSSTVYRDTNSFVMSHDKVGPFKYFVFDMWDQSSTPYNMRLSNITTNAPAITNFVVLNYKVCNNKYEILIFEEQMLELGYEGLIIRNPETEYKYGRCTIKEANAFKLKRFEDAEAVITGFEEEMYNGNNAETNELGRTKRSTAKAGLSGKNTLGAFICKTDKGIEFKIGSGFDQADRESFWNNQPDLLGQIVKYKHFPIGVKDKPRHPIFLGFRNKIDM